MTKGLSRPKFNSNKSYCCGNLVVSKAKKQT